MQKTISKTFLVTILLAISCIFSSAIPGNKTNRTLTYARLEETLNPYTGDPNSDNTDYYQTVNLTIHFYSDAACTTPTALTSNVDYEISYSGYYHSIYTSQNLGGPYGEGTAYSGNTTAYYDDIVTWEGMLVNNGVVEERYKQDYELSSIGGGIIIQPALTASHLPGF
jgi:hypothetical protein